MTAPFRSPRSRQRNPLADQAFRCVLVLSLAWILACGPHDSRRSNLELLSPLDLSSFEAPVQEQLGKAIDRWQTRLEDPSTPSTDLALASGELARLLHAYGRLDDAAIAYRNALQLDPSSHEWAYLYGALLQSQGELEKSIEPLRRAVQDAPNDLPTRIRLARSLLAADQAEAAKEQLQAALGLDPNCALAFFLAGQVELKIGEPAAAVMAFGRALELQPDADTVHGALAVAFEKMGDSTRAGEQRARAGERRLQLADPLYAQLDALQVSSAAHLRRANQARLAGATDAALAEFRLAVDAAPDRAEARSALSAMLAQSGDLDGALEESRNAQRLGGEDPRILANLANILRLRGEAKAAVAVYQRILVLEPHNVDAELNLARSLAEGGDPEQASEVYQKLITEQPGDPRAASELESLRERLKARDASDS